MKKMLQTDLTTGPIGPSIRAIAIPAMVGIIFNTMYNLVDTFWAGRFSTESLASLSLNFPVYLLAMTIGVGFSSGTSALIANYLGKKDEVSAQKIYFQGISYALIIQLILTIPLLFLLKPIFELMNADAMVLKGALLYGYVIVGGSVMMTMNMVINSALSARGLSKLYRNVLIIGFFLNLGLDPILMFGFNIGDTVIIPEMKESGIALATVIIQLLSALYLLHKARTLHLFQDARPKDFKPLKSRGLELSSQVIPGMVSFMIMATGTFVITFYISRYGTNVVAAYGSAIRIEQIALVPNMGINTALMAMVGQNNGAKKIDRITESYRTALFYGFLIMIVLLTPVLIFGRQLIGLFTDNAEVISIGYTYLLIQGITHFSYIIMAQSNSVLQGLKRPGMIMWTALYRQVVAPAVIFTFLSIVLGMRENGVWWGLVIVNWSAALFSLYWTRKKIKQAALALTGE